MPKVFMRSLVAAIFCASVVSTGKAETAAGRPATGGADSNLFEPFNQKECDYPSPCGCGCNPKAAAPQGSAVAPPALPPKN